MQQVQHEYVVHEQLLKHIIGNNPEAFGIQGAKKIARNFALREIFENIFRINDES